MPLIANSPKPRVILGLMTFGPDTNAGARITSLSEYNTFLDHLQAAGYNEIDTARTYVGGKQEAFTREAKWKERGLTIATKVFPNEPGKHKPAVLTEEFNTSLKELGTDCVDIFYLHAAVCNECNDSIIRKTANQFAGPLRAFRRNSGSC
jgi:aflatoxin B1 aldehyde reductase